MNRALNYCLYSFVPVITKYTTKKGYVMKRTAALLLNSILGGICIALGGTIFLRVRDTFPGSNVVAAFLFALGLLTICTRGYALYTGKVCYLFDHPLPSYLYDVLLVWIGNFIGCALIAAMESLTPLFGPKGIDAVAAQLVTNKTAASYLGFFLLSILCNIFIFIAVNGYAKNPHEIGKYLLLFFGVMCFILAGTEHCVANMYFWCVSGELYQNPMSSLVHILLATLGNAIGGLLFPVLEKAKAYLEA